jgi:hypothetical protein
MRTRIPISRFASAASVKIKKYLRILFLFMREIFTGFGEEGLDWDVETEDHGDSTPSLDKKDL